MAGRQPHRWFAAAALAVVSSASAGAEAEALYVGFGLARMESADHGRNLQRDPLMPAARIDARDNAWTAFAGYRFSRFVAVEAGYWDLGERFHPGACYFDWHMKTDQLFLRAAGSLPLGGRLSLYADAGIARSDTHVYATRGGYAICPAVVLPLPPDLSIESTDFNWSAGLAFKLTSRASLRASWGHHDVDVYDLETLSLSAIWSF